MNLYREKRFYLYPICCDLLLHLCKYIFIKKKKIFTGSTEKKLNEKNCYLFPRTLFYKFKVKPPSATNLVSIDVMGRCNV